MQNRPSAPTRVLGRDRCFELIVAGRASHASFHPGSGLGGRFPGGRAYQVTGWADPKLYNLIVQKHM